MAPSRLCVPLKASGTLHNWRWSGITGHGAHVLQQAGISTPCGWPWTQQRERLSVEAWCTEVGGGGWGGGGRTRVAGREMSHEFCSVLPSSGGAVC